MNLVKAFVVSVNNCARNRSKSEMLAAYLLGKREAQINTRDAAQEPACNHMACR